VLLELELPRSGPCGNDDTRWVVGSGASPMLFPCNAMVVDETDGGMMSMTPGCNVDGAFSPRWLVCVRS
jgi:hypothetical protein